MGIEHFTRLLDDDRGLLIRDGEDRLRERQPKLTPEGVPGEKCLLVRLDGHYSIETIESASIASVSDPDFVVAIPLSRLRPLINRSVN